MSKVFAKHPKPIWNNVLINDFLTNPEKYKLSDENQKEADRLAEEHIIEARIANEINHSNW